MRIAPEFAENFVRDNYWKLLSQVVKYKRKENTKQQNVPVEHQTEVMIYGSNTKNTLNYGNLSLQNPYIKAFAVISSS